MKLHLPCKLLAAVLACFCVVASQTLGAESISINFESDRGLIGTDTSTGIQPVQGQYWNQFNQGGDNAAATFTNEALNAYDSVAGTYQPSGATLSGSAKNTWGVGTNVELLKGYLDDGGSGVSINVSGLDYLTYDLYIYGATDTDDTNFSAKTVNGVSYTGNGTDAAVTGTDSWGDSDERGTLAVGTNTLWVEGLTAANLSISSTRTGGRGCIAGIQIVDTYTGTKHTGALTGDATWTATLPNWVNSTEAAGTYASLSVSEGGTATLTLDADTSTDAIVLTSGNLTIGGEHALNLTGPGTLRADSDATLSIGSTVTLGGDLNVTGDGSVSLLGSAYTLGSLNVSGNLQLQDNTALTVNGEVSGFGNIMGENVTLHVNQTAGQHLAFGKFTVETVAGSTQYEGLALSAAETAQSIDVKAATGTELGITSAGGTVTLSGTDGATDVTISSLTLTGGTTTLQAGEGTTISGTIAANSSYDDGEGSPVRTYQATAYRNGSLTVGANTSLTYTGLELGASTVTLNEGSTITTGSIIAGQQGDTTINVNGGLLNITGADEAGRKRGSIRLAHWGRTTKVNVTSGEFRALNANVGMGDDGQSQLSISGTGAVNVKGLRFANSSTLSMGSGMLNLGSAGMTNWNNGYSINLTGGTLGALDDGEGWTSGLSMTVGNVSINTTKYDAATASYAEGEGSGATIKLSGTLTANEGTTLTVMGTGAVELSGTGSVLRTVDNQGTLRLTGGSLTVDQIGGNGTRFEMTGGTLAAGSGCVWEKVGASGLFAGNQEVHLLGGTLDGTTGWYTNHHVTIGGISTSASANNITFLGNATLVGTITNGLTGGTDESYGLQLKGTLTLGAELSDFTAVESGTGTYSEGANGYTQEKYLLIDGSGTEGSRFVITSTIKSMDGSTTYDVVTDDTTATTSNNLLSGSGSAYILQEGTDYYVKSGDVTYGADTQVASDTTTGIILDGGRLVMQQSLNANAKHGIRLEQDSTINLGSGVTLGNADINRGEHTATLTGSGTYVVTAASDLTGITGYTAEGWTGTVSLQGLTFASGNLNNYGHTGSMVELSGCQGYLQQANDDDGTGKTYTPNIKLTNTADGGAAITFNNGWNGDRHIFSGDISGTGDIARKDNKGTHQYFTFTGNVSQWEGAFKQQNTNADHQTTVTFSGDATTINADLDASDNAPLHVVVDNSSADVSVSVDGTISGKTDVVFQGDSAKTITGTNTYTQGTTISGGQVTAKGASALGTGPVTVNSGTLVADGFDFTNTKTLSITLNGSTLNLNNSTLRGTVTLGEGENSIGVVTSGDSGIHADIGGTGNLTLGTAEKTIHLYDNQQGGTGDGTVTINNTGNVTLQGIINLGYGGKAAKLSNTGNVNVTGTVNVDSASTISSTGNVAVTGSGLLRINSGASVSSTIQAGDVATIGAKPTVARTTTTPTYSDVEVTASGISSIEGKNGSVSNAAIDVTGAYTMDGVTLTGTTVSVTDTGALTLNNVSFGEGNTLTLASSVTLGSGSLDLSGVTVDVSGMTGDTITLVNVAQGATVSYEGMTLLGAADGASASLDADGNLVVTGNASYTNNALITSVAGYDPDTYTLTFRTDVKGALLEGDVAINYAAELWNGTNVVKDAIIAATGSTDHFYHADGLLVQLKDANDNILDLSGVTSLTINGYAGIGNGATYIADAKAFGNYYGPNIPEPTTTTLSLLALAALAARRRRQG